MRRELVVDLKVKASRAPLGKSSPVDLSCQYRRYPDMFHVYFLRVFFLATYYTGKWNQRKGSRDPRRPNGREHFPKCFNHNLPPQPPSTHIVSWYDVEPLLNSCRGRLDFPKSALTSQPFAWLQTCGSYLQLTLEKRSVETREVLRT